MERSPYKKDFPGLENCVYLNTGAEGLLLNTFSEAARDYFQAKSRGGRGRPHLYAALQECRAKIASLLGVSPQEIAFLSSASEGLCRLCNALSWQEGDEVVIDDLEFPSNVLPWLQLRRRGVRVRIVHHRGWNLETEDFARHITEKTRVVSVSHVSYRSGLRLDIPEIGRHAASAGAIFCVDATQSLGRIPVPLQGVDYLVSSTYKWLLSPHGGGIVFCRRSLLDRLEPDSIGWWSVSDHFSPDRFETYRLKGGAERLELGMPGFLSIYGLSQALSYLGGIGIPAIESQLQPVLDSLIEELQKLQVRLMTPRDPGRRAGLVSFEHEDSESLAEELACRNIQVWGGDGRVRISIHLYNDLQDVGELVTALGRLQGLEVT